MPHKVVALKCSQPDERARAIGAANTLWLDGGVLRSTNTDVEGFFRNLDQSAPGWDKVSSNVVVVGAGGAARAIVYGLVERGPGDQRRQPHLRERRGAARRFGPSVTPRPGTNCRTLCRVPA